MLCIKYLNLLIVVWARQRYIVLRSSDILVNILIVILCFLYSGEYHAEKRKPCQPSLKISVIEKNRVEKKIKRWLPGSR